MASKEEVAVIDGSDGPARGSNMPFRGTSRRKSMGNEKFTKQIVMACVVTWCCGCVVGIIALLLAVLAGRRASDGDDQEASKFGRWSYAVSILGIVIGSLIIVLVIVIISVKPRFGLPSDIYNG